MRVPSGREGDGCRRATPHQGLHQEEADDHSGEGVLPPRLCTVHVGGVDVGDKPDGTLMGSIRGK